MKYEIVHPEGREPTRGSQGAAGLDLYSAEEVGLMPNEIALVRTGIKIAISPGWYGRIAPRSGLALSKGIDVMAGVIDSDYRGEISVLLINHGSDYQFFHTGTRIAQLIVERCWMGDLEYARLSDTERNEGGFGSTGT